MSRVDNIILGGAVAVAAIGTGEALKMAVPVFQRFREAQAAEATVLEKYGPQIREGNPLTDEQCRNLIFGEHDSNHDGFISIAESNKLINHADWMLGHTRAGWKESGENILKALAEIDKDQQEKFRK